MSSSTKKPKRPADVTSNAVHVMRIATGEIDDDSPADEASPATERARKAGKVGGPARAQTLTKEQRSAIAKKAAASRWKK